MIGKQSMAIREYASVLARRKWVIVLALVATVTVAGVGSLVMTPVYSSSTIVRIALARDNSTDYYWAAKYADRLMNTYVHLLKGRPFLKETIRRLDLDTTPKDLAKAIKVESPVNAELLTITAKDPDPWLSAALANTLGLLLVEEGQNIYSGPGKSAREILQEQLTQVESDLREARMQLQVLVASKEHADDLGRIEDLRTRIEIQEKTYAMILDEYDKARIKEAILANSITVVEWSLSPDDPSEPRIMLNLALGAPVGLVGGTGLAFLFEHLDERIYSLGALEARVTVPVLGSIPTFAAPRRLKGEPILLSGDAQSPAGEAFRVLASILLSGASGTCPKTLLVSSAEPRAGRTTVLVNLATAMARAGRKVIIVDSDFRRPRLHRVFTLPNEVGLSNAMLDPHSATRALRQTRVPGLRVLPSGPLPHYPAELLGSSGMQKVVGQLSNSADVVLFDSPPMLAVADAVSLAHIAEGVLLVAARGEATDGQLQTVLRQLQKVGARALGIVLNKARLDGETYGYYDQVITRRAKADTTARPAQEAGRAGRLRARPPTNQKGL